MCIQDKLYCSGPQPHKEVDLTTRGQAKSSQCVELWELHCVYLHYVERKVL